MLIAEYRISSQIILNQPNPVGRYLFSLANNLESVVAAGKNARGTADRNVCGTSESGTFIPEILSINPYRVQDLPSLPG
jgi:hypothetical protein